MAKRIHVVVEIVDGNVSGIYADGDVAVTILDDCCFEFGDPEYVEFSTTHSENIVSFDELKIMVDAFNKKVANHHSNIFKPFVGKKSTEKFFFSLIGKYMMAYGSIPSISDINKALESLKSSYDSNEFHSDDDFEDVVVVAVHGIEEEIINSRR